MARSTFKMDGIQWISLEESDPVWTIAEWLAFLSSLEEEFGSEAVLTTDAGYNNVSSILSKSNGNW